MAEKLQQTEDDYAGGSGAGKLPSTASQGTSSFTPSGANAAPGESDRYGGVDFAARLAAMQSGGNG